MYIYTHKENDIRKDIRNKHTRVNEQDGSERKAKEKTVLDRDMLEMYLPTYIQATTKICIMYTRLLKPFYQICHYLIISVVF